MDWVISVGGYGHFLFEGSEFEAEEKRKYKANWEHGIGMKRLATQEEATTGKIDKCLNHSNFNRNFRYHCECPNCELIKRRKKINKLKKQMK